RDFRSGLFKFVTTPYSPNDRRARREDIYRTLVQGLEGSSMPSFNVLPDEDLQAMTSYVIYLSLRGDVERGTLADLAIGETKDFAQGV
ncbi:cytochrome c, partial [Acinetobacter baumannii]